MSKIKTIEVPVQIPMGILGNTKTIKKTVNIFFPNL